MGTAATVTGRPDWVGERGGEIGAGLLDRGRDGGIDDEDETTGHTIGNRIIGHDWR